MTALRADPSGLAICRRGAGHAEWRAQIGRLRLLIGETAVG